MIGSMRKPGRRGAIVAGLACAGVLGAAGVAWALPETIVANNSDSFTLPAYTMDQGERPSFQNAEIDTPHNVTARGKIGGKALFRSPTIEGISSTLVNGTQYLNTGSYAFFCSVHPDMEATLNVSGAGTPVARPDIEVKVLSGDIDRVANSRKARVSVEAISGSDPVNLALKLRNLRLGSKANIDLDAGQRRVVVIRLTRRAKNKLSDKDRAKVKLVGSVPFGANDIATKVLK